MGGRFVWQLGAGNLWGGRRLGVCTVVITLSRSPMCHSLLRGEVTGLLARETVRSHLRCYRRHRIGRCILERKVRVAQGARQKEGLLHPLAIARLSGTTPQRDLKLNTLGGKLELSPIRTHGGAESLILSCKGCGQTRQGSRDRAWRSLRCGVRKSPIMCDACPVVSDGCAERVRVMKILILRIGLAACILAAVSAVTPRLDSEI